jgi:hypothetical protein
LFFKVKILQVLDAVLGSGKEIFWFRDAEKSDPGAGINIPESPHWGCTVPIPKIRKRKRLTTDIREKSLP